MTGTLSSILGVICQNHQQSFKNGQLSEQSTSEESTLHNSKKLLRSTIESKKWLFSVTNVVYISLCLRFYFVKLKKVIFLFCFINLIFVIIIWYFLLKFIICISPFLTASKVWVLPQEFFLLFFFFLKFSLVYKK